MTILHPGSGAASGSRSPRLRFTKLALCPMSQGPGFFSNVRYFSLI